MIWRSSHPDWVDAAGWAELRARGVRTVVDLRNADERTEAHDKLDGIRLVHAPIEDVEHPDYVGRWNGE